MFVNEAKDLFCDVSGTEPIDIEWLRDGKALDFGGELHSSTGGYLQVSCLNEIKLTELVMGRF